MKRTYRIGTDSPYTVDSAGSVVCRRPVVGTQVIQLLPLASNVVVLEDPYRFPKGRSNLYCLTQELELVWSAELPASDDVYVGGLVERPGSIRCGSWSGWACTIDPTTGSVVDRVFTK